jgi:membrane protease subunit HflK
MTVSSKRPVNIALASLILSIIFFGISFFLGRWSGFFAVSAVSWLILSVALIWFVLSLQFYQRSLAEQEKLDAGQLARDKGTSAIFQTRTEQATLFTAAQNRLAIFEKWFIPIFSALIAAYQIGIGIYLLNIVGAASENELRQPLLCGICMTAIAFVSFLISRYATGMSSQPEWKPLRAGGSSLLSVAVLCFLLAVVLALAYLFDFLAPVNVLGVIIPVLLVVLGVETALNLVLDIYRPRVKGRYSRSAFDSRLLGVINEPGGILRSVADAIDYQFGFKVSQTWFYKLLEQAIVPLVLFGAVTLYLFSCVVVVAPDEQAIVEHFGNPVNKAGKVRLLEPGLAFKWPWPIDKAYKYHTKKISEIDIGFVPEINPQTKQVETGPKLWGEAHYKTEYHLLVASKGSGAESLMGTVPVSLVIAAMPVQYRIKDLYSYIYNHNDPESVLESICYRALTQFAASASIEVDYGSAENAVFKESLLGAGRSEAKRALTERIQKAADDAGLGVEIVFLGLQGIHPPPEVAADYQKVVAAVQNKQATILNAEADRSKTLSDLVGSVKEANDLYDLATKYQQAEKQENSEQTEKLGGRLDAAFGGAKGNIFTTLREAQSYAYEKATLAEATSRRFEGQLKAYNAAKNIYKQHYRLTALEDVLEKVRKYIVVADQNDTQVYIVDVKEKLTPSLYDVTGLEETRKK